MQIWIDGKQRQKLPTYTQQQKLTRLKKMYNRFKDQPAMLLFYLKVLDVTLTNFKRI